MTWMYKLGETTELEATELDLTGYVAFVYVITNETTGKRYIGKKRLFKKVSRKPLKGKKRRRIEYKESDWQEYWGSNDKLKEDIAEYGEGSFSRVVLRLCRSLGEASYFEAKYQFDAGAILDPDGFYNDWIMVKVHRSHLKVTV